MSLPEDLATEKDDGPRASGGPSKALPGPLAAGPSPRAESSKRRRTPLRRLAYALAVPLAQGLIHTLRASERELKIIGGEHFDALTGSGKPCVVACWHAQVLVCSAHLLRMAQTPGALTFMVSPSIDGDPVSKLLERSRAQVIRGSATRSGVGPLKHLYRALAAGSTPVVAADGPQGPPHVFKAGALLLSQLAGAPVLPMACAVDWRWHLTSWDRLVVPRPFARVVLAFGEPVQAPKEFGEGDLERACRDMEARIGELSSAARGALG